MVRGALKTNGQIKKIYRLGQSFHGLGLNCEESKLR